MSDSNLSVIEAVRKRPQMYIRTVDVLGLCESLEIIYQINTKLGATRIDFEEIPHGFRVTSNLKLTIDQAHGLFGNFLSGAEFDYNGPILNALSSTLRVQCGSNQICYERGLFKSQETCDDNVDGFRLEFQPDPTIFTATQVPTKVWQHNLRRKSYLYPGHVFTFSSNDSVASFHSPTGLLAFFRSVSKPYQLLFNPIDLEGSVDDFKLRVVFSLYRGERNHIWSHANLSRTRFSGAHVRGFLSALWTTCKRHLKINDWKMIRPKVRIIAVLAVESPHVMYAGGNRSRVSSRKIQLMTRKLAMQLLHDWLEDNPTFLRQQS